MKEYKYLHTFADSSFESDVNEVVRQGWKVIHIEWLIPDVAVFLERDVPDDEAQEVRNRLNAGLKERKGIHS